MTTTVTMYVGVVREAGWRLEVWGWGQRKARAPWELKRRVDVS